MRVSAAPTELNPLLSVCTQGFTGFALIPSWAMQEYRAYGTHHAPEFRCGAVVFVKCVWVCKWIVAFVRVFVCDCMGRGIVFVKCVCMCKWIIAFVRVFVCDCMGCGIVFVKCVWVCKWIIAFVRVFVFV